VKIIGCSTVGMATCAGASADEWFSKNPSLPGLSGQPIFVLAVGKMGRPHKAGDDDWWVLRRVRTKQRFGVT
jgi:hypothetical protein